MPKDKTTRPVEPEKTRDEQQPVPRANDPGGAHAKGYSADPAPSEPEDDTYPLAPEEDGGDDG